MASLVNAQVSPVGGDWQDPGAALQIIRRQKEVFRVTADLFDVGFRQHSRFKNHRVGWPKVAISALTCISPLAAFLIVISVLFGSTLVAAADNDEGSWSKARNTLAIGAGFAPQYEGANEYRPIPYFVAQMRWGSRYFIGTDGTGLRADIVHSRFIEAGPAVGFRYARDQHAKDRVIARLPSVDASVEAGAFLALNFPFPLGDNKRDAITVDGQFLHDVSGSHDGHTIRAAVKYRGMVTDKLVLQAGPFATFGSHQFMEAYYSVTAAGSAASGLNTYRAKAGFKDAGVRVASRYMFTKHWNVNASLAYRRYVGEAKESPVISVRGSDAVWMGGVALGYTF